MDPLEEAVIVSAGCRAVQHIRRNGMDIRLKPGTPYGVEVFATATKRERWRKFIRWHASCIREYLNRFPKATPSPASAP